MKIGSTSRTCLHDTGIQCFFLLINIVSRSGSISRFGFGLIFKNAIGVYILNLQSKVWPFKWGIPMAIATLYLVHWLVQWHNARLLNGCVTRNSSLREGNPPHMKLIFMSYSRFKAMIKGFTAYVWCIRSDPNNSAGPLDYIAAVIAPCPCH